MYYHIADSMAGILFWIGVGQGMKTLPSLTILFVLQVAAASNLQIRAPHTSSIVMIDGVLSKGEWQDSTRIEVPGVAHVYIQRSTEFVYIAFEYTHSPSGIVDLYLSPTEGEIYDLHASAKLGERQLNPEGFPDWAWWNNHDWTANVSRVDSFEKRTFLPTRVREYQIRRSRFPSKLWRLRFELTAIGTDNQTESVTIFPPRTADKSSAGWLLLSLE